MLNGLLLIYCCFQVYKIRVSCPSSVLGTWFIHRRYSDFFQLRRTLIKENPSIASQISFPPKRWVGSNLDPAFLGRRLAGLQVFLASVLEIRDSKSSPALLSFLCLDKPPVGENILEENRVCWFNILIIFIIFFQAICETLKEAVKELREQLRKRERVQRELEYQKSMVSLNLFWDLYNSRSFEELWKRPTNTESVQGESVTEEAEGVTYEFIEVIFIMSWYMLN